VKRGAGPKRRTALKRGSKPLQRAPWSKTNPKRRKEAKRYPGAIGWTQRVLALYGRLCVVCGDPAVQGHHAVPRQRIIRDSRKSDEERSFLAYDARQGVPVCKRCHERHETATERIPRSTLPAGVVEWAREHGYSHVLKPPVYP
jgi:hypothetical protein